MAIELATTAPSPYANLAFGLVMPPRGALDYFLKFHPMPWNYTRRTSSESNHVFDGTW